jgi:ribosomal peptide maturation radical SAM protein 1
MPPDAGGHELSAIKDNGSAAPAQRPLEAADRRSADKRRVLFIVMPWAQATNGALGVSTLKAILARAGIPADIRYFNIALAEQIGGRRYTDLCGWGSLYGLETLFSPSLYELPLDGFVKRILPSHYKAVAQELRRRNVIRPGVRVEPDDPGRFEQFLETCEDVTVRQVPVFLERAMSGVPWESYDVVGFSILFDQMAPSLSLARRVKRRFPKTVVIFGGPCCGYEAGTELLRCFPFVDIVVSGEADMKVVPLLTAVRNGGRLAQIPGIAYREGGHVRQTRPEEALPNLDWLPVPCYADYLSAATSAGIAVPHLYFESSRGCWWGNKHQCSFCGRSGGAGLKFRYKSPDRLLAEMLHQEHRYGIRRFVATDNLLPFAYFTSLLPQLASINEARPERERLRCFYFIKSNITKERLLLLRRAGVTDIAPGIETFSNHILTILNKGACAVQQLQCLKWCTELHMGLEYGVMHSVPGETAADYERMSALLPYIRHLRPPFHINSLWLTRHSPMHDEPERFGIGGVEPSPHMGNVYIDGSINLGLIANVFSHKDLRAGGDEVEAARRRFIRDVQGWQEQYVPDRLIYYKDGQTVCVLDRRARPAVLARLAGLHAAVFLHCDRAHPAAEIEPHYRGCGATTVAEVLDWFIARKWMVRSEEGWYLTLPTEAPEYKSALAVGAAVQPATGKSQ